MENIAVRFKHARESAGLSKAELARALKVTQQAVGQIEKGRTKSLKGSTLLAMERVTGISGRWIETGRGPKASALGQLPQDAAAQADLIHEQFLRLPAEHQARIRDEVDFLLSLQESE